MMTTLADFVGPEFRQDMLRSFGTDMLLPSPDEVGDWDKDYSPNGLTTGEYLWDTLWRFGLVEDKDVVSQRSCGDLWRPDGRIANGYYIPDDEDSEVSLVSIDSPPVVDTAWDARPI